MKYAWIEAQAGWQPIARLCKLLGVSRSGFLQWRKREPSNRELANRSLDAQVAVIHAEGRQGYGRIRVTHRLRQCGMRVGAERVRKSLRRQHLRSVYRKRYRITTDSKHCKPVAQNLLDRRFDGWSVNRAWTSDITYLLTDEGWLYLAVIVDLGTRRIVGWAMSERMSAKLVCDALQMAYWRRRPVAGLLMHSDRGSQYASDDYRKLLKQFHMIQSMSRKGNCWDNACSETLFGSLKVEWLHGQRFATIREARDAVLEWLRWYNRTRMHSTLQYSSPAEYEQRWIEQQPEAAA